MKSLNKPGGSLNKVGSSLNRVSGSLNQIKPLKAPRLAAGAARAHNKTQKGLQGGSGIKIHKAEGNTRIDRKATADDGYTEESASDVVGSDGKLLKAVRHTTYVAPADYPTGLGCGATGANPNMRAASSSILFSGAVNYLASFGLDGIYLQNNNKSLDVDKDLITANMSIVEIDVCDGGVAKKMLVIGSAPY